MVRKQLYIEEYQERVLKSRARTLGVSEAELVRQALSAVLKEAPQTRSAKTSLQATLLQDLFKQADQIAQSYPFTELNSLKQLNSEDSETFDRQALYEQDKRQSRW